MFHGQRILPFLAGLSKDAGSLQELIEGFRAKAFDFCDSQISSFYGTIASPTAQQDDTGKKSMSGKRGTEFAGTPSSGDGDRNGGYLPRAK